MKKLFNWLGIFFSLLIFQQCKEYIPEAGFEDMEQLSIYDYIVENDSLYSKFRKILIEGGISGTMSAYNPNGDDYTLFLPTNNAIDEFISSSNQFSSFEDLLANKAYVEAMARYHVVNMGILTDNFPFGALPELNLSGQFLTIGFEMGEYKVNNEAPISRSNIEVSNGYIHVITKALTPLIYTTYQWLGSNPDFSIFYEAVNATGFNEILSRVILRDSVSLNPITLLVEPDSVYNRYNIFSFNDLVQQVSPENSDYTSPYNNLYNFVGCHILDGSLFLSSFEGKSTNYSTFGNKPMYINGEGLELAINMGDTIVSANFDTVYYTTFYYDLSNELTQSGTIHLVNQLLYPRKSSLAAEQFFEFFEEPIFNQYRQEGGEFLVEDSTLLSSVSWTGGNDHLLFVKSDDEEEQAWNKDYIKMEGDFSISYTLPKIAQGNYTFGIRAHARNVLNALVEVYFDGVKIGGLVDLTTGGSNDYPYVEFELGKVTLLNYESHVVTVKSLIPGLFYWDYVHLEPVIY